MPTDDSRDTFCLYRSTPIVASVRGSGLGVDVPTVPRKLPVCRISAPMFAPLARPVTFPPTRIGTSLPLNNPMRRLKKGRTSSPVPGPKSKMSAPCRKNVRFSGKTIGKRVRLVRRVSTSVSAKSVFTVSAASAFAPRVCVTSRLASRSSRRMACGPGTPVAAVTDGRTLNPSPSANGGMSVRSPAR